jgi:predicted nucleotidyltransferase
MAVMSGDFVQRGTPAFTDKWVRTKMALNSGVNLVVELPALFAFQDAGGFASGAVNLLERTGICDHLIFGSESGDIELLKETAKILVENEYTLSEIEEKYMKKGFSHPNARKYALNELLEHSGKSGVLDVLSNSNDILGLEYLKALKKTRSSISATCIKRIGSSYHNEEILEELSSATAIRKEFYQGNISNIQKNVPESVLQIINDLDFKRITPNLEDFETTILNKFRALTRDHIKRYYGFTEGLDLRFTNFAMTAQSLDELLLAVKSKRFTYTRLQRLLLYFLFELTVSEVKEAQEYGPQYIRVLGFDEKGRELLSEMKKTAWLPIISTPSTYNKTYNKYEKKFEKTGKPYYSSYNVYKKHIQFDFRVSDYYTCLQWGFLPDSEMDIKKKPLQL